MRTPKIQHRNSVLCKFGIFAHGSVLSANLHTGTEIYRRGVFFRCGPGLIVDRLHGQRRVKVRKNFDRRKSEFSFR